MHLKDDILRKSIIGVLVQLITETIKHTFEQKILIKLNQNLFVSMTGRSNCQR